METKTKLIIGMIITLILATSGTYYLTDGDEAFYCQSRDIVIICEKISSGIGTRCYYEDTYKVCSEGWVKYNFEEMEDIKEIEELVPIQNDSKTKQWRCNQTECVEI